MSFLRRQRRAFEFLLAFGPLLLRAARFGPDRTIDVSSAIASHVHQRGARPALIGEQGSLTWSELDAYANRTARWALERGLQRGDVVALLMENRPEYVAIWLGLSRVGVVTALLNTNLLGDRLAHCMREADAKWLIVGQERVEAAASALTELESPPEVAVASAAGEFTADLESARRSIPGAESFEAAQSLLPAAPIEDRHRAARRGRDGLFLIYTSGTTGLPKAARISHSKALATGLGAAVFQRLTPEDRVYCCLPLYHSAGGMMAAVGALLAGSSLVIARRFSAKRFWSDCVQHEVTAVQYIGELFRYLLNSPPHPDERSHSIRTAIGNGLRPEVWGPFQERFRLGRIVEFYGATEGNLALVNFEGRVGAVGQLPEWARRALGVELVRYDVDRDELVRGPDGHCVRCETDEPGELLVRISGTTRFEGYTNEEASQKKVLRGAFAPDDAYFRSGDLLRRDEDGFYYFVDRIDDTFRWKGENVATSEVAEVLSVVEGVEEANVYGVEIPGTDGRAGMAAIVTTDAFDLEAFGAAVEQGLASYARPVFVRLLPEMEITGTFKHRKVELVKEGFDPESVSDPILFRDPEKGAYTPLDRATHDRIVTGEIRV